jgi:hypothetical protein
MDRLDGTPHGAAVARPQIFDLFLVQKGRGQIGLRIEIGGHHPVSEFSQHPRDVVDQ